MNALPGSFEYVSVDLNSNTEVEKFTRNVYDKYGKIDWVLHGAGIQISKHIIKKELSTFQKIISTKINSLGTIYRSINKLKQKDEVVNYHLLTSTFSYLGNDGQPDYGAANEAMNLLVASMNDTSNAIWTSLAWLGWAGIGMTKGTEYAALATARNLAGVTKEGGQKMNQKNAYINYEDVFFLNKNLKNFLKKCGKL